MNDPITRIFVLCKTQRRISELIETTKALSVARYVRFATFPLKASQVLTADVWQSCDGDTHCIIRSSTQK